MYKRIKPGEFYICVNNTFNPYGPFDYEYAEKVFTDLTAKGTKAELWSVKIYKRLMRVKDNYKKLNAEIIEEAKNKAKK